MGTYIYLDRISAQPPAMTPASKWEGAGLWAGGVLPAQGHLSLQEHPVLWCTQCCDEEIVGAHVHAHSTPSFLFPWQPQRHHPLYRSVNTWAQYLPSTSVDADTHPSHISRQTSEIHNQSSIRIWRLAKPFFINLSSLALYD